MKPTATANLANAIMGLVLAVLTALVAFGVKLTVEQLAAVNGLVAALLLFAAMVIANRGADRSTIVEQLVPSTGKVVAGEASELPTGAPVRELGDIVTSPPVESFEVDLAPDGDEVPEPDELPLIEPERALDA